MASRFPRIAPTRTLRRDEWQPDEFVTIKTFVGGFDRERIASAAAHQVRTEDGSIEVVARFHEMSQAKLDVGLVGWTFYWLEDEGNPDSKRTPVPFAPDNVRALPIEDRTWIIDRLDEEWARWGAKPTTSDPAPTTTTEQAQQITDQQIAEVRLAEVGFQS